MMTYQLIEVDNIVEVCGACPTIFDFTDTSGRPYYFRLRHGSARICYDDTDETIISDVMPGFDGVCCWEDVVTWAAKRRITLIRS